MCVTSSVLNFKNGSDVRSVRDELKRMDSSHISSEMPVKNFPFATF